MSLTVFMMVITLSGLILYISPSKEAALAAGMDVKVWFNFSLSRLALVAAAAVVVVPASFFNRD
ncbi:hypothetical protein D3C79_1106010 [compost metagenome]